jgi:predicted nucleic acid binding AN1-type Zn finger protein
MTRCGFCNKKSSMPFDCKYCNKEYCAKCRYQETHKCENLEKCKSSKHQTLVDMLTLQKTESVKIIKI